MKHLTIVFSVDYPELAVRFIAGLIVATAGLHAQTSTAPVIQSVVNAGSLDERFCPGLLVTLTGVGLTSTASIMVGGKPAAIIPAEGAVRQARIRLTCSCQSTCLLVPHH